MGQKENWKLFIETTQKKAESHEKVAQYWHKVHIYLGLILILLSAVTTVLAAIKSTPKMVTVGASGVTTLLSTVIGFLQPSNVRAIQSEAAKEFRSLTTKMIRCETDGEYEKLWQQYNKLLMKEPFLPKKYKNKVEAKYSMAPELEIIINEKEKNENALSQRRTTSQQWLKRIFMGRLSSDRRYAGQESCASFSVALIGGGYTRREFLFLTGMGNKC